MSTIIDELIVALGFKLKNSGDLDRFKKQLDGTDKKARRFAAGFAKVAAAGATGAIAFGSVAVREFLGVERTLTRIGINADVSREKMMEARQAMEGMADDFGFPNIDEPVKALDMLIARGMAFQDAMAILPSIMATAQASGSVASDIAGSAFSIAAGFKIANEEMGLAFDIIAKGGKEGAFELKDMAKVLPSLIPQMKALGFEGIEGLKQLVAMLQTVRLETGSSAEAATNLQNVLAKMESQETINKFRKVVGVDLPVEIEKGVRAGKTKIEAFLDVVQKAVAEDSSRLNKLFVDMQVQKGVRALLGNREEFAKFLEAVQVSEGTIDTDLTRILQDTQADIDRTMNAWGRFKTEVGAMLAPVVGDIFGGVADELSIARKADQIRKKAGVSKVKRVMSFGSPDDSGLVFEKGGEKDKEVVKRLLGEDSKEFKKLLADAPKVSPSGITINTDTIPPETLEQKMRRRVEAPSTQFGPGPTRSNGPGLPNMQDVIAKMNASFAKLTVDGATEKITNDNSVANDNRNQSVTSSVVVNQTVNGATAAPGAAARATGQAVNSAVQQQSRIASQPSTSGNGPQ